MSAAANPDRRPKVEQPHHTCLLSLFVSMPLASNCNFFASWRCYELHVRCYSVVAVAALMIVSMFSWCHISLLYFVSRSSLFIYFCLHFDSISRVDLHVYVVRRTDVSEIKMAWWGISRLDVHYEWLQMSSAASSVLKASHSCLSSSLTSPELLTPNGS